MGRFDRLPGINDSHSRRRNVVIGTAYALAGCVGVSALAGDPEDDTDADATGNGNGNGNGDGGGGETQTDAPTEEPADTETDPETETEESTPESPDPVGEMSAVSNNTGWLDARTTIEGSGESVTDTFAASFFTTFTYEHNGQSNFAAELIDDQSGDTVELLVNEIGTASGCTGVGLPDGEYLLDVDADGDWSFDIGEPFAPDDEYGVPPGSIEGEQPDVYGEIEIDGRVTVSAEHRGDGNFTVAAWDEANTRTLFDELLFNEIGNFEGETTAQLNGLFYMVVQAGGPYSIEITET
jgi:hypothetical protein